MSQVASGSQAADASDVYESSQAGVHAAQRLQSSTEDESDEHDDDDITSTTTTSTSLEAFKSRRGGGIFVYQPPTLLSLVRSVLINMCLPFVNGVMLGFGEIFAHEIAFQFGWRGARVRS